jgi:thioesterase domain-containing protein
MNTPRGGGEIALSPDAAAQIARMKKLANIAFGQEVTRKVVDAILPLNDAGSGPPLYCVHSITGCATEFRFMAEMLGPYQKFYGIQAPTACRTAAFPTSIEAVARYYVQRLVEFQPAGDLMLGGYSVGAMIALEMAQQLRALGRDVKLIVVFDGELFNTGRKISKYNPVYWIKLALNFPAWVRDFLMVEFTFRSFCRTVCAKVILAAKAVLARTARKGDGGHAVEGFIDLKKCTPDHAAFMKTLFDNQYSYVPREYPGRVIICVARTQALAHLRQVAASWLEIAPFSEIARFNGTHTSIMRSPKGQAVADHLARMFAELADEDDRNYINSKRGVAVDVGPGESPVRRRVIFRLSH